MRRILAPGIAAAALLIAACAGASPNDPATTADRASSTAIPSFTATPSPTAEPTATPPPIREDCNEIRGTPYRNSAERDLFLTHCVLRTDCAAIAGTPYRNADERLWYLDHCVTAPAIPQGPGAHAAPPAPIVTGSGIITLSFDDSAGVARAYAILDMLAQYGARAVFCVNGGWAASVPDVVARIRNEGHRLCNHTAAHPDLTTLSDAAIRAQIAGGAFPDDGGLLRPPYGAYDARVSAIVNQMGYTIYLWSIDTRDWEGRSADVITQTVLGNLHPGAIVLLHVHGASTLDALPRIIEGIRGAGYEIGY